MGTGIINLAAASIVFLAGTLFLIFAHISIKKAQSNLAMVFILMNIDMAVFSFGYGWELMSTSLESAYVAIKFQYLGLAVLSIYWVTLAYKFRTNVYPSFKTYLYLTIVPSITIFMIMTNEYHQLFYTSIRLDKSTSFIHVVSDKGYFYYLFIIYSYIVLVCMLVFLYKSYKFNKHNLKLQNKLMLIASVMPTTCNVLYLFGFTPHNFDPTPFGFLLMSFFSYRAIFEYSFLDLKDVVRGCTYENVEEGVFVLDTNFRIIDFNHQAFEVLNFLTLENTGNFINDYPIGKVIKEKSSGNSFELSIEKSEKLYVFHFKKSPILVHKKLVAFIYIFSDVTSAKETITDLSYIASHDFLTGIYNRMSFINDAQKELARLDRYGGELSLVMIDIDFFKKVNDTFGHIIGDEVLRKLAKVISNNLRATDIFSRLGGEEFCILLPETSLENAKVFSEKIRKIIEQVPFYSKKGKFNITISLGISYYSQDMNKVEFEELLDLADSALYISKNNGRNQTNYAHISYRN